MTLLQSFPCSCSVKCPPIFTLHVFNRQNRLKGVTGTVVFNCDTRTITCLCRYIACVYRKLLSIYVINFGFEED